MILLLEPFWHHVSCILILLDELLKVLLGLSTNILIINKVLKILVLDARLSLDVFELLCTEQIVVCGRKHNRFLDNLHLLLKEVSLE